MTLFDKILSLCRLDHRIGGCARFDSGRGACSRWILPLQEKKLKLNDWISQAIFFTHCIVEINMFLIFQLHVILMIDLDVLFST